MEAQAAKRGSNIFGRGRALEPFLWRFVDIPRELGQFEGGASLTEIIKTYRIHSFDANFLDVGCGSYSRWLANLSVAGFRNFFGVDPLVGNDVDFENIRIYRRDPREMIGHFDLITLLHSLEHMPLQHEALGSVRALLKENGTCLIRIPIVSSFAWQKFGVNWVELDAPRHLYLHSNDSIRLLAQRAGLELYKLVFDSQPFEFYGSEQYVRDIPLTDPQSVWINRDSSIFSRAQKVEF